MSVLIDTGVFFAHHDPDASRHAAAVDVIDAILEGDYGQPYTTDYVLDETITLTHRRSGQVESAKTVANRILGQDDFPSVFELLYVGRDGVSEALSVWEQYDDHGLSFTDATSIAILERRDLDAICSFDDDFDGIIDRIDPTALE